MEMYDDDEVETNERKILSKDKIEPQRMRRDRK